MCFLIKRKRGRPINRQTEAAQLGEERGDNFDLRGERSGGGLRKQTNFGLRRRQI